MRKSPRLRIIEDMDRSRHRPLADAEGLFGSRFVSGAFVALIAIGRSGKSLGSAEGHESWAHIESALVDLGRIFHYAEGGTPFARLEDELDFARRYLGLQALRFEGRLRYRVAACEEWREYTLPRLSSFPAMETAIADALELSTGTAFIVVEVAHPAGGGLALRISRGTSSEGPMEELQTIPAKAKHLRIKPLPSPSDK